MLVMCILFGILYQDAPLRREERRARKGLARPARRSLLELIGPSRAGGFSFVRPLVSRRLPLHISRDPSRDRLLIGRMGGGESAKGSE